MARTLIPKEQLASDIVTTTSLPGVLSGATAKVSPVDADTIPLSDSASSGALKRLSWSNAKVALKSYFDTFYATISHTHVAADIVSGIIAAARLGSGTTDATTVLYGDGTWKTAPSGGGAGGIGTILPFAFLGAYISAGATLAVNATRTQSTGTFTLPTGTWELTVTGFAPLVGNTNNRALSTFLTIDGATTYATAPVTPGAQIQQTAVVASIASGSRTVTFGIRNDYTAAQGFGVGGAVLLVEARRTA